MGRILDLLTSSGGTDAITGAPLGIWRQAISQSIDAIVEAIANGTFRGPPGQPGPPGEPGPPGNAGPVHDFSVNAARVDRGYPAGALVLRTGARTNAAGAYTGGGTGNKAIAGTFGYDGLALGSLASLSYTWNNVVGPTGPTFIPPGPGSVLVPYMNLIVDFNPAGPSDLRVLVLMDSSAAPVVAASIGTYTNDGSNNITHAWTNLQNVQIVNAPPNAVPGGVPPAVSVGPTWPENSYSFAALVAANPTAILRDVFPSDGGLPAGAIVPSLLLVSGDSGNITRSGKYISALRVNGVSVL